MSGNRKNVGGKVEVKVPSTSPEPEWIQSLHKAGFFEPLYSRSAQT